MCVLAYIEVDDMMDKNFEERLNFHEKPKEKCIRNTSMSSSLRELSMGAALTILKNEFHQQGSIIEKMMISQTKHMIMEVDNIYFIN